MIEAFYFGCVGRQTGHRMEAPEASGMTYQDASAFYLENPWGPAVDAGLCPNLGTDRRGVEGHALLHHRGGWTALAFWDRSGDWRGGSNSVFFAKGTHDFAAMLDIARECFPSLVQRCRFEIRLANTSDSAGDSDGA